MDIYCRQTFGIPDKQIIVQINICGVHSFIYRVSELRNYTDRQFQNTLYRSCGKDSLKNSESFQNSKLIHLFTSKSKVRVGVANPLYKRTLSLFSLWTNSMPMFLFAIRSLLTPSNPLPFYSLPSLRDKPRQERLSHLNLFSLKKRIESLKILITDLPRWMRPSCLRRTTRRERGVQTLNSKADKVHSDDSKSSPSLMLIQIGTDYQH